MPEFQFFLPSHKPLLQPILMQYGHPITECSFCGLYAWAKLFASSFSIADRSLFVRSFGRQQRDLSYFTPIGPKEKFEDGLKIIADDMESYCSSNQVRRRGIIAFDKAEAEETASFFSSLNPKIEENRNSSDYVYQASDLASLEGRKYQPKRNHISFFERNYQGWSFELIDENNLEECKAMNEIWCAQMGCVDYPSLSEETCSVRRILSSYKDLDLEGGILRYDGKVIAYTIGEQISGDSFIVHIEKAFPQYRGSYPLINREFVRYLLNKYPSTRYINREDDAGDDGLRRAKLSYHPAFLLPKYFIHLPLEPSIQLNGSILL